MTQQQIISALQNKTGFDEWHAERHQTGFTCYHWRTRINNRTYGGAISIDDARIAHANYDLLAALADEAIRSVAHTITRDMLLGDRQ